MRGARVEWVFEHGKWNRQEFGPQDCVVRSRSEAVKCAFLPKESGTYRVKAEIIDDRGRRNESELTLWVAGDRRPTNRSLNANQVELIPDRQEYIPGDMAKLLVQSQLYPAEGVMTLARSGIVRTERFKLNGPSTTLSVPIEATYVPNVHVNVELVGAADRTDEKGNV